jgi:hypothetical protein
VTDQTYEVGILVQGDMLQVLVDGKVVFSETDSSLSSGGSIGLYSWGNAGSYFDDIQVNN